MKLSDQLPLMPFVRILIPLTAGILTARFVTAPDGVVFALATLLYIAAWFLRQKSFGQAYLLVALWATGIVLSVLTDTRETMPRGERLRMAVEIRDTPSTQGRWQRTTASVGYFRSAKSGVWEACEENIQLYVDTCYKIAAGEQFTFRGYLNAIDTLGTSYGRLMRSRGLSARSYLTPGNLLVRAPEPRKDARYYALKAQQWAVERLSRLPLDTEEKNLLLTLVAGERRGLDRGLRADYSKVGVSHILSVSGLHMGFVLILINLLTFWLPLFRHGHLIRNALVILGLWAYAVVAGLSPSVIRAALMMSLAQVALGFSVRGNRYNLLLGAATLMLGVNPHYLFDISFQLSFLAVLSILFLYPRLYRRRINSNRFLDSLWSTLLLGLAAQVGTLPLVAYSFGNIPLVALGVNPVVILCSFVAVSIGFCWLLLPVGFLGPAAAWIISSVLHLQNTVVRWSAALPFAAVEGVKPNGWYVAGLYALMIGAGVLWKLLEERQALRKRGLTD